MNAGSSSELEVQCREGGLQAVADVPKSDPASERGRVGHSAGAAGVRKGRHCARHGYVACALGAGPWCVLALGIHS